MSRGIHHIAIKQPQVLNSSTGRHHVWRLSDYQDVVTIFSMQDVLLAQTKRKWPNGLQTRLTSPLQRNARQQTPYSADAPPAGSLHASAAAESGPRPPAATAPMPSTAASGSSSAPPLPPAWPPEQAPQPQPSIYQTPYSADAPPAGSLHASAAAAAWPAPRPPAATAPTPSTAACWPSLLSHNRCYFFELSTYCI